MTNFEKGTMAVSLVAIVISVYSIIQSYKAKKQNDAIIEMEMINNLLLHEKNYVDSGIHPNKFEFSKSQLANYYEVLCKLFIDNKIDKGTFQIMYFPNIEAHFYDDFADLMIPDKNNVAKYENIKKVIYLNKPK